MLTIFDNDDNIFNVAEAGAGGYILKNVALDVFYKGIIDTLSSDIGMNPSIAMKA